MDEEKLQQWADQELERYSSRPQTTMSLRVERIDNDPQVIDDGNVIRIIPRDVTFVLYVDEQEIDRKVADSRDKYSIVVSSGGKASLMIYPGSLPISPYTGEPYAPEWGIQRP